MKYDTAYRYNTAYTVWGFAELKTKTFLGPTKFGLGVSFSFWELLFGGVDARVHYYCHCGFRISSFVGL